MKNLTTIGGCAVTDLVQVFGTPFYCYDADRIGGSARRIATSFQREWPHTEAFYAVKANPHPRLVALVAAEGLGADCAAPLEVLIAERAGIPRERRMYTGNYESRDDLQAATRCGAINLDDIGSLDRLPAGYDGVISFRINPGKGKGSYPGIVTGGPDAKFGIPLAVAKEAYRRASERGFRRFGIHLMAGSNNRDASFFAEMARFLCGAVEEAILPLGVAPEYLDIGGGFGIPYRDEEEPLDLERTAFLVAEEIRNCSSRHGIEKLVLRIEPGRFVVGDAGYLVTRVTAVKKGERRFVGLDTGMNTLLRPALYGAFHRVSVVGKESPVGLASLCGRLCENTDIFVNDIPFPAVAEGDIVVFHDCGAYCATKAFAYNGRLRPAEVLCDKGMAHLISRAESVEEYLARFS